MPRWRDIDDETLDERLIYTMTYGHRDCDAAGSVWSHTLNGLTAVTLRAMNADARMHANEYESARSIREGMWVVGPFGSTVSELIDNMEDASRVEEMRNDIRHGSTGFCY